MAHQDVTHKITLTYSETTDNGTVTKILKDIEGNIKFKMTGREDWKKVTK